jgi:hypothetical protein
MSVNKEHRESIRRLCKNPSTFVAANFYLQKQTRFAVTTKEVIAYRE